MSNHSTLIRRLQKEGKQEWPVITIELNPVEIERINEF